MQNRSFFSQFVFRHLVTIFGLFAIFLCASGCRSRTYAYHYVPGKTAVVTRSGHAIPPAHAPPAVRAAIEAGNRIAGLPYRYGGGHRPVRRHGRVSNPKGYDCSGATSYILNSMGLLREPQTSNSFRHYGNKGPGEWVNVYARTGHVFLVIAGLRFDTGWGGGKGPHWTTISRPTGGFVVRHPANL